MAHFQITSHGEPVKGLNTSSSYLLPARKWILSWYSSVSISQFVYTYGISLNCIWKTSSLKIIIIVKISTGESECTRNPGWCSALHTLSLDITVFHVRKNHCQQVKMFYLLSFLNYVETFWLRGKKYTPVLRETWLK